MLRSRIERLERKRNLLARLGAEKAREARSPEQKEFEAFVEALGCDDDFLRELQQELIAIENAFPVDLDRPVDIMVAGRPVHYDNVRDALKSWGKSAVLTEEERAALDLQKQEATQRLVFARWEAAKRARRP